MKSLVQFINESNIDESCNASSCNVKVRKDLPQITHGGDWKSDIMSAYNRAIKENRLVRLEGNIYSLMEELRETGDTIVFKFEVLECKGKPDFVSLIEVIF